MSPAKKKKKSRSASKRREPRTPKGMYLDVSISDSNEFHEDLTIRGFPDIVSVGHRVARAVREYIRGVPMLPHVRPYTLTVFAHWNEEEIPPRFAPETKSSVGVEAGEEI